MDKAICTLEDELVASWIPTTTAWTVEALVAFADAIL